MSYIHNIFTIKYNIFYTCNNVISIYYVDIDIYCYNIVCSITYFLICNIYFITIHNCFCVVSFFVDFLF